MIDDDELIQIFIEEARDLLAELRSNYELFSQGTQEQEYLTSILRGLHTFKGSARMVELTILSEFLHTLEQWISGLQNGTLVSDEKAPRLFLDALDFIHQYIDSLKTNSALSEAYFPFEKLEEQLDKGSGDKQQQTTLVSPGGQEEHLNIERSPPLLQVSSDVIRVKTGLLEEFSALAGRVNIARSHLEQQLEGVKETLLDMNKNVKVVHERTKLLQTKADVNIKLFQSDHVHKYNEDFDILELDRYSYIQQTSRALVDELERLEDSSMIAINTLRNAQGLLTEQGRAAKNLEESITHTRMISLEQLVPRLERIVQQVSHDVGKEVHLACLKAQGEVDRNIVEKLIPALEHMVRNAIDHGIESPLVRKERGKPETGTISLSLFRHGNEIMIQLGDDGQGIDIDKINKKAVEKKLWKAGVAMTMHDAMQVISFPGFSTKDTLTTISGLGVGMDVVNTEINKLGGRLEVETKNNVGTEFTIRLPFTLSLNKALIFLLSGQPFALPLSSLMGMTRISKEELKKRMSEKNPVLNYADREYKLSYLSEILEYRSFEYASEFNALPVIFLESKEGRVGFILDGVLGSREIVIKPVGIQLQFVREISGLSFLGNGRIIIVLNAPYLIERVVKGVPRIAKAHTHHQTAKIKTKILVVDDSSTVRQVLYRFLKRNEYDPFLAKSGVEALSTMKKSKPDIILLDIEMPGMNGFEVIEAIKQIDKYKTIPVIMITSRAGEKHRLKAMHLGASEYLVKPYLEGDLLALLQQYEGGQ